MIGTGVIHARPHVQGVGGVDPASRSLQDAFVDHSLSASFAFLAGLKHEDDLAGELIDPLAQLTDCPNQTGHVAIVATSVHIAIRAGPFQPGTLHHRESVHISTQ